MSLLDVLRSGVEIINQVTKPLQATVQYARAQPLADAYTTIPDTGAVPLRAIVDWTQVQVRTRDGVLSTSRAVIMLLDIAEVVAATGGEGIDDADTFTLPDGTTGPILDMKGFIDAGTGHPIATEIYLG